MSTQRGRDSYGRIWLGENWKDEFKIPNLRTMRLESSVHPKQSLESLQDLTFLAQLRAEPTHEFVSEKTDDDVGPYTFGKVSLVHNGTIANDKELLEKAEARGIVRRSTTHIDSAALAMYLADLMHNPECFDIDVLRNAMLDVKGSFGIAVAHANLPGRVLVATNYKPLYYLTLPGRQGFMVASQFSYLEDPFWANQLRNNIRAVEPYSVAEFKASGDMRVRKLPRVRSMPKRVLAVCSGGLDSTVAVALLRNQGAEVDMLHYLYGSRADGREVQSVNEIGRQLGCRVIVRALDLGIKPESSALLNPDANLSVGASGAEFAHEWVPARNLIMLAHAIGLAEAEDYDTICLGNNLEESNSHPDNEMEFINRLNALIPFSVGVNKNIRIEMPVGNLMKREIIHAGVRLNAPLSSTYSCYEGREHHCGKCASCYLRRTAFKISGVEDPTRYET